MKYKQYRIHHNNQEFQLHQNNTYWIPLSDSLAGWYKVTVTSWNDNGYITGTYELRGLNEHYQHALNNGYLYIGVVRRRSAGLIRSTGRDSYGPHGGKRKQERTEAGNICLLIGSTGTFSLKIPQLIPATKNAADFIRRFHDATFTTYQRMRLGFVRTTRSGMLTPFVPITNTEHTYYYDSNDNVINI